MPTGPSEGRVPLAEMLAWLRGSTSEIDLTSSALLLLGAISERPTASLEDADELREVFGHLADHEVRLDRLAKTMVLLGAVTERSAGPRDDATDIVDVLGSLAALTSQPDLETSLLFLLGAATERSAASDSSASSSGDLGGVADVLGFLADDSIRADRLTKTLFLLGVMVERSTAGLPAHELARIWEPGAVLGHLFEDALGEDTGNRALFLLGVMTERSGRRPIDVLGRFTDPAWAMRAGEKAVVLLLASVLRPTLAIDAGTYRGGSAAALSDWSDKVVTIDLDPSCARHVAHLTNVEFRCGRTPQILDEVLREHDAELVVLDADHSERGITAEVAAVLRRPGSKLRVIVIHDTAMPTCRRGLDAVDWANDPTVRGVSLDFLPGEDSDEGLICGMALIWTDPTPNRSRPDDR
ncbi:MAG: hypothetical protein U0Q22_08275 [Acidimicrobiales bacterium]